MCCKRFTRILVHLSVQLKTKSDLNISEHLLRYYVSKLLMMYIIPFNSRTINFHLLEMQVFT